MRSRRPSLLLRRGRRLRRRLTVPDLAAAAARVRGAGGCVAYRRARAAPLPRRSGCTSRAIRATVTQSVDRRPDPAIPPPGRRSGGMLHTAAHELARTRPSRGAAPPRLRDRPASRRDARPDQAPRRGVPSLQPDDRRPDPDGRRARPAADDGRSRTTRRPSWPAPRARPRSRDPLLRAGARVVLFALLALVTLGGSRGGTTKQPPMQTVALDVPEGDAAAGAELLPPRVGRSSCSSRVVAASYAVLAPQALIPSIVDDLREARCGRRATTNGLRRLDRRGRHPQRAVAS